MRPWINLLAGAWAFISGFWYFALQPANYFFIGVVIAIFGFWTYRREWQGIVNGLIGLWLIFSAFVPGLMVSGNIWICGIIVMALATWRMISVQGRHPATG